jgi:hypothetical protein
MSDVNSAEPAAGPALDAAAEPPPAPAARRRIDVRRWLSTVLFLLVTACFGLPFASTSCTLPGGYARGAQGTSTVYRGVDLAFDAVPAVTPPDKPPRADSLPNEGQLGFQPLVLLALLVAAAGIGVALATGAGASLGLAASTAVLLAIGQWAAILAISGQIGGSESLPSGKTQGDYVSTGPGFLLALVLLVALMAVNLVAIGWEARRTRASA